MVDATSASRSHIASPSMLNFIIRNKFATLISDVATTGNSGSGVFDPNHKCLLGIMSRKFTREEGGEKTGYCEVLCSGERDSRVYRSRFKIVGGCETNSFQSNLRYDSVELNLRRRRLPIRYQSPPHVGDALQRSLGV